MIHKAIEVLEPQGPGGELALAYSLLSAHESIGKGLPQKGLQLAEKALAMAKRIGSPEVVAWFLQIEASPAATWGIQEAGRTLENPSASARSLVWEPKRVPATRTSPS